MHMLPSIAFKRSHLHIGSIRIIPHAGPVKAALGLARDIVLRGRVCLLAMHVLVQAVGLLVVVNPHAHHQAQGAEDERCHRSRVSRTDKGAHDLLAEERAAAAVEEPVLNRKQASHDGACQTSNAVEAEGVQCVVDLLELRERQDGRVADRRAHGSHDDGPDGRHEASRWRDHHQATHGADHRADTGRLLQAHGLDAHPREHGGGGREVGGGEGAGGGRVCSEGRAAVEAAPTEPEQRGAQEHEGHVVRLVPLALVAARAQDHRGDQARRAGADVHHGAAGEVQGAPLLHPAAGAPDPVAERHVDEQAPERDEQDVGLEADALHERPREDGRGDDREGHLEDSEGQRPDRALAPSLAIEPHEEGVLEVSDEGVVLPEGEAEADKGPDDADDSHGYDAHHHGVDDAGVAHEAPVEEREAWCHQEHHSRGCQDPGRVTLVRRSVSHRRGRVRHWPAPLKLGSPRCAAKGGGARGM
mmetsp:Transcript_101017/g.226500  ORF Transcript_101017/g.226500 Transcript_101017/m.226500 type:complete len:473 (-) Transcript_101017:46-1464(-)